ncbi:flagellar export protein FliJ [Tumebacillus permanentifrigoris]|uniref:Flagellar FliJ protein n=1 Tax=Tumebacillus permanentifrigoris TaxID=378543 RepID=A0A316D9V2_9BACL|nr:flagellar FliJ family protein [Tumebacillus permanentifrigoris]PWK12711.1 flagellar export protein FliJ [Tumebacillus permanentifrigoris]
MSIRMESLHKITGLKNRLTQQANWRYSESLRSLETEQQKLQELLHSHDQSIGELHSLTMDGATSQELQDWLQFMLSQRNQIERQNHLLEGKRSECTEKRQEMTESYLEEQKWVKLQGRRLEEHQVFLNKIGQEALDEIAVTRHQRIKG